MPFLFAMEEEARLCEAACGTDPALEPEVEQAESNKAPVIRPALAIVETVRIKKLPLFFQH
jgi:hypothetical protein